ncbi:MAG: hypothetical protein ACK4GE_03315 [Caldimicrobium sp.]
MKGWEDLAEALSAEVKREIAESYFQEKIALEEAWKEFIKNYKILDKKEEAVLLNACRLMLMLKEEPLIEEFQNITNFSLRSCYYPQILESSNIKRRLFGRIKELPFGFTSKSRFVKLFLKVYEDLIKAYKVYIALLNDLERQYELLKKDTEAFYRRYDLSSMFTFFRKIDETSSEIAVPEEKEKIYEELRERLKIPLPEAPSSKFDRYFQPLDISKVRHKLIALAKKAYSAHQEYAKELMGLVSKKD